MPEPETGQDEQGFSLIELLTVVIIIGILAAIAIPRLLEQREDAWNSAAVSDLRSLIAVETGYIARTGGFTEDPSELAAEDWRSSPDIEVCADSTNGSQDLTLVAWHPSGSAIYSWTSTTSLTTSSSAALPADCAAAIAPGATRVSQ